MPGMTERKRYMREETTARGESSAEKVKQEMRDVILREPHTRIDYISICDLKTFADSERISGKAIVALAVHIGRARLIDNCIVEKV